MKKSFLFLFPILALVGCDFAPKEDEPSDPSDPSDPSEPSEPSQSASFIPEVGEVRLLFNHGTAGETRIYNYCPTIFIENGVQHVYYCANKDEGNVTDYVSYRKGTIDGMNISYTEPQYLVSPGTMGHWDSRHACDPSVVKGQFKFHGESYSYLMAYLGCVTSDCTRNETGIAVAKAPEGPWIKCDFKLDGTTKINPIVPYTDFQVNTNNWGTGQPSLFSVDKKGKVILFTTVGASNGTFTNVREYDFSNIDEYQLVREQTVIMSDGIKGTVAGANFINNGDFGYDPINKRVILAKPRQYFDSKAPGVANIIDVYYLEDTEGTKVGDVLFAGNNTAKVWKQIGYIDQELTGFLKNHNTGLITDEYGYIDATKNVGVAFTRSDEETNGIWSSLSTYRIYATGFKLPKKYFQVS